MTKLFDGHKANQIRKRRKIQIAAYTSACAVLLTGAVLFAVFYKQLSRTAAQLLSSICLCSAGCYSLIFADYMIFYKKILDICRAEKSLLTGRVKTVESNVTTYRSLPFYVVEITLQEGGERRAYLYEGTLKTDCEYRFEIAQNIICSYEESV